MTVGIDILEVSKIQDKINSSSEFLNKILYSEEISNQPLLTLLGKISAKESIMKTGYIKPTEWLKIKILNSPTGAPIAYTNEGEVISEISVSISHTETTVVSVAIYDKNS